ncbi:hypothetical protein [Streptomyces sp. NBC_01197]|nr:hypothetical protein OG452_35010 [Streptomyces sp. NBC_01197]
MPASEMQAAVATSLPVSPADSPPSCCWLSRLMLIGTPPDQPDA